MKRPLYVCVVITPNFEPPPPTYPSCQDERTRARRRCETCDKAKEFWDACSRSPNFTTQRASTPNTSYALHAELAFGAADHAQTLAFISTRRSISFKHNHHHHHHDNNDSKTSTEFELFDEDGRGALPYIFV